MPTKLREFYWNELLNSKNAEAKLYENATKKASASSSKTRRK
jgi:hypothetical protein